MNHTDPFASQQVLCVVAPFYNEEEIADRFYEALRDELLLLENIDYRLVFVDDGSTDRTLERLNDIADRDEAVSVLSLSRNFGHQMALTAGLDHAQGDAVVVMDSDLQHPPALIRSMVEFWREGNDIVSAVRQQSAGASWFKRSTASLFYWLAGRLSDTPIVPGACDFCLLSRVAHEALLTMRERHRFLRGMVAWLGFRRAFVPFDAPARTAGRSKYTLSKMIRLALDGMFSFSAVPMAIASRVGSIVLLAAACYLAYVLGRYCLVGDLISGWSSLICTVLILNGMQLIFIGLIGEYLARTFDEAKGRPLYLLKPPRLELDTTRNQPPRHGAVPAGFAANDQTRDQPAPKLRPLTPMEVD
jgi:dolichol-phosphate mannosyltransferase